MRICFCSALSTFKMAEGARFELAAHEVGAGFQDRWIKPLSHPSELGFQLLAECTLLAGKSLGTVWEQFTTIPNAFATSPGFKFTYRWCRATLLWPAAFNAMSTWTPYNRQQHNSVRLA